MSEILNQVSQQLHLQKLRLVTAESCTGGWLAKQITDLSGSSSIFDRGFVTYSNESKNEMLGVSNQTIEEFGAVSENVVIAMAEGALENSHGDLSIAISGVAGPDGGTEEKPIGMVCFAWKRIGEDTQAITEIFNGDRYAVRSQAVDFALSGISKILNK